MNLKINQQILHHRVKQNVGQNSMCFKGCEAIPERLAALFSGFQKEKKRYSSEKNIQKSNTGSLFMLAKDISMRSQETACTQT